MAKVVDSQLRLMIWLKKKIEEQLGKATKAKPDPTSRIESKIQKKLCKFTKENKFTNKTYFDYIWLNQSTYTRKKTFRCDSLFLQ